MLTLADVKLNNDYDFINPISPTVAEKEPLYTVGKTWLAIDSGYSYILVDQTAGTWQRTEQALDYKVERLLYSYSQRFISDAGRLFFNYRSVVLENTISDIKTSNLFTFVKYKSIYGSGSVSGHVLTFEEFTGDIEDIKIGDEILINSKLFTVTALGALSITVSEAIREEEGYFLVIPLDYPQDFIDCVGRLLHYDMYDRPKMSGLKSEKIGTYSYTKGDISDNGYPSDLTAGLEQYIEIGIGETGNYEY